MTDTPHFHTVDCCRCIHSRLIARWNNKHTCVLSPPPLSLSHSDHNSFLQPLWKLLSFILTIIASELILAFFSNHHRLAGPNPTMVYQTPLPHPRMFIRMLPFTSFHPLTSFSIRHTLNLSFPDCYSCVTSPYYHNCSFLFCHCPPFPPTLIIHHNCLRF